MLLMHRPFFKTVNDYVHHLDESRANGREPWAPNTVAELEAALEHFPQHGRRCLPSPCELTLIGLPAHFGREVKPFPELFQERFLTTLEDDFEFRDAVNILLNRSNDK